MSISDIALRKIREANVKVYTYNELINKDYTQPKPSILKKVLLAIGIALCVVIFLGGQIIVWSM